MEEFDLIMVVTHQNNSNIYTLINSIRSNIKENRVLLLIVSQECEIENVLGSSTKFVISILKESKMSLSKARNKALKYLTDNNIIGEYIMFPDDDSSFDSVFFINLPHFIGSNKNYITPIYNFGSKDLYLGKEVVEGTELKIDDYHLVGSPNQIVKYGSIKDEVKFDENLGVGALYGSCEDLDFFIKVNLKGEKFFYSNRIYSYHPSKFSTNKAMKPQNLIKRYKLYSMGFVFLLKKYDLLRFVPVFLIRSIGGCLVSLFLFRFKMAYVYFVIFLIRIKLLFTIKYKLIED